MEHSMPLVIFTFLSQMAIGAFAALFFYDVYKEKVSKRTSFISLLAILALCVMALIGSVFHLGHPFAAYRAILNFGDSWLTREIVFFPAFVLFVFFYAFLAKNKKQKQTFGWLGVISGAVTIFCTAMIYTIPAVPAWNNGTTMATFFTTALLLGPIFIQMLISILEKEKVNGNVYTMIFTFLAITLNVVNLTILQGGLPAAVETAGLIVASPLFWVKVFTLLAAFLLAGFFMMKKKTNSVSAVSVLFFLLVVSEFLGRMLFYSSGVHL